MTGLPAFVVRPGRERIVLLAAIGAASGLAWWSLLRDAGAHATMARGLLAPHVHAATWSGLIRVASMWFVMMVAMMLPPLAPWLVTLGALARPRGHVASGVALFAAGYFVIWLGYSVAAAGAQLALRQHALLAADLRLNAALGGALLVGAGLFQLSTLKGACLSHCRNPLSFFLSRWKDGPAGAFKMGFRHGTFCLACCWALMAVSFALGVMNLVWMAVLTLILCVETIAPGGAHLSRLFGLVLMAWGLGLAVASAWA